MFTVLTLAAALAAQPDPKQPKPAEPKLDPFVAEAVKPDDKDSPLRKFQKERVRERAAAVALTREVIRIGQWDVSAYSELVKTQASLAENLAELMDKPEDKVKCYEMRVEAMKENETFVAGLVKAGRLRPQDLNLARAARIDAEIDLLKLKGPEAKPGNPNDPEELVKAMIADMNALAAALDKKESPEKVKGAAEKLKAAAERLKSLKLRDDQTKKLFEKHGKNLIDAAFKLAEAQAKNPEAAKLIEDLLKDIDK